MNFDELPTISHLKQSVSGFKHLFKVYSFFSMFGLKNKRIDEAKKQFDQLSKEIEKHSSYTIKFNRIFSEDGWIVHDSIDYNLIRSTVDTFEKEGKGEARKLLLEHFKPENIEKFLFRFRFCDEFKDRYKFIEYAFEDYKQKRYYAVIPLLLMVIDGAVNDNLQKGFHAQNIDLTVWDSITSIDGGIDSIKQIFQKSRTKTITEPITLPYRHGILHGRDLGYDNYEVAAKAWNFLFIVRDWINAKRTEQSRKNVFIKETTIPSIKESLKSLANTQKIKERITEWKPRHIEEEYIGSINNGNPINPSLPEYTAIEYCNLWCKKNYGYMSNLYALSWKPEPKELRELYGWLDIASYELISITDEASAISEIIVKIELRNGTFKVCKLRIIYEDSKGDPLPRNIEGGNWKVVIKYIT
ncbi:MAG: hypothetical protein H8D23_23470 [Candidatus Brocadiales bacterium]|nr:hypothetical protein [Candidatus Brocadiales bacterium]